jgi:hypothetical protein
MWQQYLSTETPTRTRKRDPEGGGNQNSPQYASEHFNQTLSEIKGIIQTQQNELSEIKRTNQSKLDGSKPKVYPLPFLHYLSQTNLDRSYLSLRPLCWPVKSQITMRIDLKSFQSLLISQKIRKEDAHLRLMQGGFSSLALCSAFSLCQQQRTEDAITRGDRTHREMVCSFV